MSIINKVFLDKIFDGSTGNAYAIELVSKTGATWVASIAADGQDDQECFSNNLKWQQIQNLISRLFIGMEIDESVWNLVSTQINSPKIRKYCSKNLRLLLEIVAVKVSATNRYLGVVEYVDEYFGFKQEMFSIPTPLITIFNGGRFGDTNLDFEDYLLIPLTKNKDSFSQKLNDAVRVYNKVASVLRASGYDSDVGVLGGYAPSLVSTLEALDLILAAISLSGFDHGKDFGLGLNIGSANLYDSLDHKYLFKLSHNYFNTANLNSLYHEWLRQYPIFYLEDCLSEHDLEGWQEASQDLRDKLLLAGNRLFNGEMSQFRRLLKYKLANTIVLNLRSGQSLMDLADLIKLAKRHNYQVVLAGADHETDDDFVAEFAVAAGVDFVKFGSLSRLERVAKYNKLLKIASKIEVI